MLFEIVNLESESCDGRPSTVASAKVDARLRNEPWRGSGWRASTWTQLLQNEKSVSPLKWLKDIPPQRLDLLFARLETAKAVKVDQARR